MSLNAPLLCLSAQLEEANTLLRAESESGVRLRKTQAETMKQIQQLGLHVTELEEKSSRLEDCKQELEKEVRSLQSTLEVQQRDHSQDCHTISDLQGVLLFFLQSNCFFVLCGFCAFISLVQLF